MRKLRRGKPCLYMESLEPRRMLATFIVGNAENSGAGSLRQAILDANASVGFDEIVFDLSSQDRKIELQTSLPPINAPTAIDGTSQPGYAGKPIVELDGSLLPLNSGPGLHLTGGNSLVLGLAIHSFQGPGVRISGSGGNTVSSNYIGTNLNGELARPNGFDGILIVNSANNLIGGKRGKTGNLISGNLQEGVRVQGHTSTFNRIQGNYIGTDAAGLLPIGNETHGILVQDLANGTIVGTDGDGIDDGLEGNVISGNGRDGVRFFGASNNIVAGNWIGVDVMGTQSISNLFSGVSIDGVEGHSNLVGSNGDGLSDELERNVISGNLGVGVYLVRQAHKNLVSGNFIGADVSGTTGIPNAGQGVLIQAAASANVIGTTNGEYLGNLISGNGADGIKLQEAHNNILAGNVIGLNAGGNGAIPNAARGVLVQDNSQGNLIGTDDNTINDATERNVISGNRLQGIAIAGDGTEHTTVAGNYIGTDSLGRNAIPNQQTGILVSAQTRANIIGTSSSSARESAAGNLISGNLGYGLRFRSGATGNSAGGNWIGLDATGENSLGNQLGGVSSFQGATNNRIGGRSPQEENIISGNAGWGIQIQEASGANQIVGNRVGVTLAGSPGGNKEGGILIESSSRNEIGDGTREAGNTIAFNGGDGVAVMGDSASGNNISRNSIFMNDKVGIDLGSQGREPNDPLDADSGPNGLQNWPILEDASNIDGRTRIGGRIQSLPETNFHIELFGGSGSSSSDDSKDYLGSLVATTDSKGLAQWSIEIPFVSEGRNITATMRNPLGNTSEFAEPIVVRSQISLRAEVTKVSEAVGVIVVSALRPLDSVQGETTVELSSSLPLQALVPDEITFGEGRQTATFEVQVFDDSIPELDQLVSITVVNEQMGSGLLHLQIQDNDEPQWYNVFQPLDVNGDRFVSPIDALLTINYLNSGASTGLDGLTPPSPPRFLDVNNDGFASPLDALLVINFLNSGQNGEAESSKSLADSLHDEVLAAAATFDYLQTQLKERRGGRGLQVSH